MVSTFSHCGGPARGLTIHAEGMPHRPEGVPYLREFKSAFTLPFMRAEVAGIRATRCRSGEFNERSAENTELERDGGSWRAAVALRPGRSYRYRYLLDGERWENAWQADGYVPNPHAPFWGPRSGARP